tara:strand:- start:73 stop:1134 length:1062 start_codon:yes stop_codon:yes gene_type:complete
MGFYTKVDYSRQLKQSGDTVGVFSGSSTFEQTVDIGSACTVGAGITGCGDFMAYKCKEWTELCGDCNYTASTTGYTFMVAPYSSTSASSMVTITPFSAITGYTPVVAIGKLPTPPLSGTNSSLSTNPGISASTLQIANLGLLLDTVTSGNVDLQIDESGNVVRGSSSSKRYKTSLRNIGTERYKKLLDVSTYFFKYIETGADGFGLIAEELDALGFRELVIYDGKGRPDNIHYKLLSVALLNLIQGLYKDGMNLYINPTVEADTKTKVVNSDYVSNGEDLLVVTETCKITLSSENDKKLKIKSLSSVEVIPDNGLIDMKWESLHLDGDSCVEFSYVEDLSSWVIVSSDGLKNS